MQEDRGPWMLTTSGKKFYLADPRVGDFDIEDVASGLSRNCRFNGQLKPGLDDDIYSVAQHSVYVYRLVLQMGETAAGLWAILHDATESPYGDMISPLKRMMPEYCRLEDSGAAIVRDQFNVPYTPHIAAVVHKADKIMGVLEGNEITSTPSHLWDMDYGKGLTYDIYDIDPNFHCWGPRRARDEFLAAFREASDGV